MGLWKTRHKSLEWLAKDFKPQAAAIEQTFALIDQCIDLFDEGSQDDLYCRMCGFALVKARNYALGAYGLMLDGLGQEAGALIRPFIEYHELLVYFREDPARVQEVSDDCLPSAGKRAELINGYFHPFRQYLSEHASHSSYSHYSLSHVLDHEEMKFRKEQQFVPKVLNRNVGDLFVQLLLLGFEAIKCLEIRRLGSLNSLATEALELRETGIIVFELEKKVPRP